MMIFGILAYISTVMNISVSSKQAQLVHQNLTNFECMQEESLKNVINVTSMFRSGMISETFYLERDIRYV